ncbi:PhoH family protein [Soehngenia saccharolytica]|nr:PhoH family protein [Soehngenia saccharolytica]
MINIYSIYVGGKILSSNKETLSITVEDENIVKNLFGNLDKNIELVQNKFNVNIHLLNDEIVIQGDKENASSAYNLLNYLIDIIKKQKFLSYQDIVYSINILKNSDDSNSLDIMNDVVTISAQGKSIMPKTIGQKRYVDALRKNDIVFGIGPAGTGKTYLAMAMAVQAFKNKEVNRIILTRPAVEAGENLGFLPGDLQEKVDPYLRPIYDALFDILGSENFFRLFEKGLIEVAPLAYMRGRTLNSSYVILDEAQNTTNEQMKMFLTRLGFGSKAIITGDVTQIDLAKGKQSGLVTVSKILKGISGIEFINLTSADIVRHPLVQKIIEAYERVDNQQ